MAGEHPHGLFHVMHCEWRLHRQFLMWCAGAVDNEQVIEDPNVSVFNVHRVFFLNVLTRACAEYVNFVAKLPGAEDLSDPEAFWPRQKPTDTLHGSATSCTMPVFSYSISTVRA